MLVSSASVSWIWDGYCVSMALPSLLCKMNGLHQTLKITVLANQKHRKEAKGKKALTGSGVALEVGFTHSTVAENAVWKREIEASKEKLGPDLCHVILQNQPAS